MPKRLLLTGAAGFIGSHALAHVMENTDWEVVGLVSFRHKGDSLRLEDDSWDPKRVTALYHDLAGPMSERLIDRIGPIDYVWNVAAESHVDRSIAEPEYFILNNTQVAVNVLQYARVAKPQVFVQVSTDEVYGPAPFGHKHEEWSSVVPSNPYSASKACMEAVAISYWRTYGVPVIITNTMNNYGERQDSEKFIPMIINKVDRGEVVPIHGRPGQIGSRFYLHARNHADALLYLTREYDRIGVPLFPDAICPARYNVVGDQEVDNFAMAQLVAKIMDKELKYGFLNFHDPSVRPGHDARYALDGNKLEAFGWRAPVRFEESLTRTVRWSLAHPEWLV